MTQRSRTPAPWREVSGPVYKSTSARRVRRSSGTTKPIVDPKADEPEWMLQRMPSRDSETILNMEPLQCYNMWGRRMNSNRQALLRSIRERYAARVIQRAFRLHRSQPTSINSHFRGETPVMTNFLSRNDDLGFFPGKIELTQALRKRAWSGDNFWQPVTFTMRKPSPISLTLQNDFSFEDLVANSEDSSDYDY